MLDTPMFTKRLFYRCFALCVPALLRVRRALLWCADAVVPAALPLYEMTTGVAQTQILASFVAFKLPERLRMGPASFEQLCQMAQADSDAFARFLRSSLSLGLLGRQKGGHFCATARTYALCADASVSMAAFAGYMASRGNTQAWSKLHDVLKTGEDAFAQQHGVSVWDYFEANPSEGAQFSDAMTALTRADGPAIAHAYPFDRHRRLCDVGGGRGALLGAILQAHPGVEGVVLDQPSVAQSSGLGANASIMQRMTFVQGSFFESVPAGCDAYVLRHVLHDWNDTACGQILRNCRRSMGAKSRLLVIESCVETEDSAFLGAMKDLTMAVVCGGRERGTAAMGALLAAAGLRLIRTWPVAAAVVIWEAEPENKSAFESCGNSPHNPTVVGA